MTLKQFKILITIAQVGSVGKASEQLHIAQPALSRQVRLLEEELGTKLFIRRPRGMELTPAGELIVNRSGMILRQVEDIKSDLFALGGDISGNIVLAIPPSMVRDFASRAFQQFMTKFPKVTFRIVTGITGQVAEWLLSAEVDLAVVYEVSGMEHLKTQALLNEDLFLIGKKDDDFALDRPIRFKSLSGKKLMMSSIENAPRQEIERIASKYQMELNIPFEVDSVMILKNFVQNGHGYTILPMASVYQEVKKGTLKAAPISAPKPSCRLVLASSPDRPNSVITDYFSEIVREEIKNMLRQGISVGEQITE
ncbi:MAG: LysR family transcriptional regulator [Alphaproteobacteria bacterium]|nr:LysR family transcriptional regulator [Alphaproteobacteria bacterium]